MVKRIDRNVAPELDKLNQQDASAVLTHFGDGLARGRSRSKENPLTDELIVSLADAYENKRARQVTEWELHQHVTRRS